MSADAPRLERIYRPGQSLDKTQDILQSIPYGCTDAPEAVFKAGLERQSLKYTSERREILKAVLSTHTHFDADWLFVEMRKTGAKASKATIYRSLVLLCEMGILREVFRDSHGAHYEHVYGHEHHEHMICLRCGQVMEFTSGYLEQLQEEACRAQGFSPLRHHLQVYGYCQACKQQS